MNELINTTKVYCKICNRFIGYMQKDRRTLQAPETICHNCEKAKQKQETSSNIINTMCVIALTLATVLTGIWIIGNIIK